MMKNISKNASFLGIIEKSLKFEADESEQNDNKEVSNVADDKDLDSQLDSLKPSGGSNAKSDSDDSNSDGAGGEDNNPEDVSTGGETDEPSETDDLGSSEPSESGGSDSFSSSGSEERNTGSAPRKLALYAEFNRLYNVMKETLDAFEETPTENSSIKDCVAQLQSLLTDTSFVLQNFSDRSEEDIMFQFHIVKERLSLVLELLSRQTKK